MLENLKVNFWRQKRVSKRPVLVEEEAACYIQRECHTRQLICKLNMLISGTRCNAQRQKTSILLSSVQMLFRDIAAEDFLLITLLHFSYNSGLCTSGGVRLADTATFLNYLHFRAKNAMSRTGGKFSISSRVFSWHKATVAMK